MTRRLPALALCVLCSLSAPATSQAGIIEWIDNLSGPGPFWGVSFEWRLVCVSAEDKASKEGGTRNVPLGVIAPGCVLKQVPKEHHRVASLNLQFGLFWDKGDDNQLKYADPSFHEDVKITTVEPSFWLRPYRAVELGSGVGVAWFGGPGFDSFTRVYLKPIQLDVKPIALLHKNGRYGDKDETVAVRVGMTIFPAGFESKDFGALPGFKVDRDILFNWGIVFDLDPLFSRE